MDWWPFPTLAELAARHDLAGLRTTLSETLRAVITLTVPAAAALILLGRPLLALLYQRGSFDAAATEAVYVALRFFALGLVGHASLELVARAFFAQKDTVTPLLIAVTFGVVHVLLALLLTQPLGHGGLALANSLAISGEVLLLLLVLRKRWGHIDGRAIMATVARVALATLVMSAAILTQSATSCRTGHGTVCRPDNRWHCGRGSIYWCRAIAGRIYLQIDSGSASGTGNVIQNVAIDTHHTFSHLRNVKVLGCRKGMPWD